MSGGSYDYAYIKVEEFLGSMLCRRTRTPERIAFGGLLKKVIQAMHDIEWVDSCDKGVGDEIPAIKACFDHAIITEAVLKELEQLEEELKDIRKFVEAQNTK